MFKPCANDEARREIAARFTALADETRAKLNEVIRLADGPNEYVSQMLLDGLAARARRLLGILATDVRLPLLTETHGSLGYWGPNGRGPQVDALLAEARWHAARSDALLTPVAA